MNRDLGNMGESYFSHMCSSEGIVANKAIIDKKGWDFLIELPSDNTSEEQSVSCKVQIKATDKKNRKIAINLSNMLHFATDPLPCFFVFIEYNHSSEPKAIYLLHFDKQMIAQTLKRKHIADQNYEQYNKKTITVKYNNTHKLYLKNKSLRNYFEGLIEKTIPEYSSDKNKLLKTLGYEDGCAQLNVTFQTTPQDLINAFIGQGSAIKTTKFQIEELRFGIPFKDKKIECGLGELTIEPYPTNSGVLKFKYDRLMPELRFNAKTYAPPSQFKKNPEIYRVRISTKPVDISFTPYSNNKNANIRFNINDSELIEVEEMIKILTLYSALTTENKNVKCIFEPNHSNSFNFSCICKEPDGFEFDGFLKVSNTLIELKKLFLGDSDLNVSLKMIEGHCEEILQFYKLSEINHAPVNFKIHNLENGIYEKSYSCLIAYTLACLDTKFCIYHLAKGQLLKTGKEKAQFHSNCLEVVDRQYQKTDFSADQMKKRADELLKSHAEGEDKMYVIYGPDKEILGTQS